MWLLALVSALAADVTLTHQGRLLDAAGQPLEGSHPVTIGLYGQSEGGTAIYEMDGPIRVDDGYYAVSLGPIDAAELTGDVWVDVAAGSGSLGDRVPLGSVPRAAYAQQAGSAAAIDGVGLDLSGCGDGDVLTFRTATQSVGCEPAPDTGVVVNVTTHVSSTRRALSGSRSIVMETFSVNKQSPTSILLIQGTISGWGNESGDMQQGWRYGSNPEVRAQSVMYDNTAYSKIYSTSAVMAGISQTGPQNLVFRYFAQNNQAGNRPFRTYNPNSSDDGRNGQTQSVYVVWEIEP